MLMFTEMNIVLLYKVPKNIQWVRDISESFFLVECNNKATVLNVCNSNYLRGSC